MAKLIAFVSTFCLVMLMIGMVAYFRFIAPHTQVRKTMDAPAIVKEVQQLNELVTVRYVVQKVVGLKEQKVPVGEESILLMVEGRVLAGINLAGISQYDVVRVNQDSVTFRLPAPKIIDAFLEEKNTKVWDRQITWWTPWVPFSSDLEHKARLQALEDVRAAALQMGILTEAEKNAELAIRKIMEAFGMQVHFEPPIKAS